MRPFVLTAVLLALACGATAARAADVLDLQPLAQALVPARCSAPPTAALVARLPPSCFVPFAAVREPGATIFAPPVTWYRLRIPGAAFDGRGWALRLGYMVDHGTVWVVAPSGRVRAAAVVGMDVPVAHRAIPTYEDRLPLPAAARRGDTLVLLLTTSRANVHPFELRPLAALHAMDESNGRTYDTPMAFFNGMLLSMALFNLLLFGMLRQRSFLLYSLAMLAMIAFQTVQSGVAWTLVWPTLSVRDEAPAWVAYLVYFALVTAFARSFLALRRVAPRTDAAMLAALGLLAVDSFAYVVFPGFIESRGLFAVLDPICVTTLISTLVIAGLVAWKHGIPSARYYVIGFGGAAVGLFLAEAADYGLIALPVWDDLCSAAGVAWEAIFLAFALAERVRIAEREATRLTEFAYRDQLTGIANRRAFDEALEGEWRRGARNARPLALLIVDIDRFKEYNDRFGHQRGDLVLRAVAEEIAGAARRSGDFAARYGGEEFALILAETTGEGAYAAAESLREAIRSTVRDPEGGVLTVSIGVAAVVPDEAAQPAELIALADGALYAAKGAGRDCSALAEPRRAAAGATY